MPRPRLFSLTFPKSAWGPLLAAALVCLGAGPALADNDWLGIEVPRPLDAGRFSMNIKLDQTERQWWQEGDHPRTMTDPNTGLPDQQDLITIDTRLDWQVKPRLIAELDVPLVFSQVSPSSPTPQYYDVNTPGVSGSQGLGDLRLGLRTALRDQDLGFNAGWTLSVVVPSGLGPEDAPTTLASTGAGRWQLIPGFVIGGKSDVWESWLQVNGLAQLGDPATVGQNAYVSWGPEGGIALPSGGVWLGPRYGADSVAGLAWAWYHEDTTRIALAIEAKVHWLSPWTADGRGLGLAAENTEGLTPEIQARYGRFSAIAGWQAQYIWATETPFSLGGDIIFDVAYTF